MKPVRRFGGCSCRDRSGFTLVEVLVAFLLLSVLAVAVQQMVSIAVGGSARADGRLRAETVARTVMQAPITRANIERQRDTGELNGTIWTRTLTALPFNTSDQQASRWFPVKVTIEVLGRDGRAAVFVETVRLVDLGAAP